MRFPKMRHAPSSRALLRTRLGDQPRCFAKVSGVVTAGSVMVWLSDGNIIKIPSRRGSWCQLNHGFPFVAGASAFRNVRDISVPS
jgi:hypothetical protein